MRTLYFSDVSEHTLRVRMIPDDRETLLARIEGNIRTLEQIIPFPCIKKDAALRYIPSGKDRGKFEVSFTLTCDMLITKESATHYLLNAGFKQTVR